MVQDKKPLDCKLWPIMIIRTDNPQIFDIVISDAEHCLSLQKTSEEAKNRYYTHVIKALNTPKYIKYYRAHPELSFDFEDWMIRIGTLDCIEFKK